MSARLRRALAGATAVTALAACPLMIGTTAQAAPLPAVVPVHAQFLPPIGAEIPSSMIAVGSKLEYGGRTYTLDFRGGIKQRIDVNPYDPFNSVRLRTVGFRVSGESEGLGSVTFEQNDVDVDAPSTLRLTQRFPPKFEERDMINFSADIEEPGGKSIVLQSKEPMVLIASLTQYPAKGDRYQLQQPVELVNPEHSDTVVARLTAFPSKRGGL